MMNNSILTSDPKVRDAVIPVFRGDWDGNTFAYHALVGTAFLIGQRGFALTAAHVTEQMFEGGKSPAVGFVSSENKWIPMPVIAFEKHPEEDVAIVHLGGAMLQSWLSVDPRPQYQTVDYDCWGYPIALAELSAKYEAHQLERPDLVYTRGYVRRRISSPLPMSVFRGSCYYEISEAAGQGCSGGPIILRSSVGHPVWSVIGIYIGELQSGFSAGYAVRSDVFYDWRPALLGHSILEECNGTANLNPG